MPKAFHISDAPCDNTGASTTVTSSFGRSVEDRPLRALHFGRPDATLRVLVVAGQHGDERHARIAVEEFAGQASTRARELDMALTLVPDANPDAALQRQRRNALAVDLNRDHQLLSSPETRALHRLMRALEPHLFVDVHTYPTRRRHLLQLGLAYCHDIFVELPTNPNAGHAFDGPAGAGFLGGVTGDLERAGFRSARYTLFRPKGRVRHGTLDIRDARNWLSVRYGLPCVLVEGRTPRRSDGRPGRNRAREALKTALRSVLETASARRAELCSTPERRRKVALSCRYVAQAQPRCFDFLDLRSGQVRSVRWPSRFESVVRPYRHVHLPCAYAIPSGLGKVIEVLSRHGFHVRKADFDGPVEAVRYRMLETETGLTRRRPRVRAVREPTRLRDYVQVSARERSGVALALLLEPRSRFGLVRYPGLGLRFDPDGAYPILRLER
ncbi:MAG: succinylglutamate desuccinylase/aspartoacylase family protein [Proteobacteria bacterium]|nr:succinylglutamate desuccinylase/aspartoacylase family protein [Pseudomonadota bacterium]